MKRITLEQQSAWLAARKRELGLTGRDYVPANRGTRRTPTKQALLGRLDEIRRSSKRARRFLTRS